MSRLPVSVLVVAVFVAGCVQPVDPSKSSGHAEGGNGGTVQPPPPTPGGGGVPATPPSAMQPVTPPQGGMAAAGCDSVKTEALRILKTNCAPCHQNPANQANFSFVLDVDRLAMSASSTGKRFIVAGYPEQSRLFERVANGEMPPPIITQRPTANDVMALRQWISGCITLGTGGFGQLDAGAPDTISEPPSSPCAQGNVCPNGGCCVDGYCRLNGQACTAPGGGDNIPGTCTSGSCVVAGQPACGNVNQPCCGAIKLCTAPGAVCPRDGATCVACGKSGGTCCKVGGLSSCDPGLDCVNNAFPNPGTCKPCGGNGQDCCGEGIAARRTCNAGLTCQFLGGTMFICGGGTGNPPPADAGRR
jgi:hypothetical protein